MSNQCTIHCFVSSHIYLLCSPGVVCGGVIVVGAGGGMVGWACVGLTQPAESQLKKSVVDP